MADPRLVADLYAGSRERLLEIAGGLDDAAAASPVPACPEWTVKDVYAHLAGVVADGLAGRLEGVTTDPWTARQVAERAGWTLAEVCDEWRANAPVFEAAVRAGAADGRLVIDAWTHEQDVRGALDRPGARDAPSVPFAVDFMLAHYARAWPARLAPVRVVTPSGRWDLGEAAAGATVVRLDATDFDVARALVGRRSRAQYLALGWTPDDPAVTGPIVEHLHAFTLAAADVPE